MAGHHGDYETLLRATHETSYLRPTFYNIAYILLHKQSAKVENYSTKMN